MADQSGKCLASGWRSHRALHRKEKLCLSMANKEVQINTGRMQSLRTESSGTRIIYIHGHAKVIPAKVL